MVSLLKTFKDIIFNPKDENEIIEAWAKIRLLDKIEDDNKKKNLALAYNKMAKDIMEYKYGEPPCMDFDVIAFPMIRRIIMDPNYTEINEIEYALLAKSVSDITFQEAYDALCEYNNIVGEENGKTKNDEILQYVGDRKMWEIFGNPYYNKKFECDIEAEGVYLASTWYVLQVIKRDKKTE